MLGAAALCTSCVSEDRDLGLPDKQVTSDQTGTFRLKLNADAGFEAQTRALSEANYRNTANYTVQLINTSNSNVLMECRGSELSSNLPKELEIGSYEIKAFYGTEHAASRNDFRVEGSTTFTIRANEETTVTVDCLPTCGKVSVNFSADMATYYDDFNVTYGGTAALAGSTIAWAKDDNEPWYVKLNEGGETLTYTVNVTAKDDYAHVDANGNKQTTGTATGTFTLQRNRAHKLTVSPVYNPTTEGGLKINITIDESTNDKPITIEVPVTWI
jgi:hypothetical protein